MKLAKSLLLGSAAGFVAVTGAQAADLPTRKAAPVDYVRICSVYGPGFFYIPGTDTCIKIGGKAELDLEWDQPRAHADPSYGTNVARPRQSRRSHGDRLGSAAHLRAARHPSPHRRLVWLGHLDAAGLRRRLRRRRQPQRRVPELWRRQLLLHDRRHPARIERERRVGVHPMGRLDGRSHRSPSSTSMPITTTITAWAVRTSRREALAYTYTFGNGFSATLAIEDGIERRNVVASVGTVAAGNIFPSVFCGRGLRELRHHLPGDRQPDRRFQVGFPAPSAPSTPGSVRIRPTSSAHCASIKAGARLSCPPPGTM